MISKDFPPMLMLKDAPASVTPLPGKTFLPETTSLVKNCQSTLEIILYQWRWLPHERHSKLQHLNNEVLMAARRKVKVRILLNKEHAKHHLTSINGLSMRYLREAGCEVKFGPSVPSTHAKIWIFDMKTTVLGSHNMSKRAVFYNDETSAIIKSGPVAMEFRRYFDLLWKRF